MVAALQQRVAAEGGRVIGTGISLPANLAARWGLADLRSHDPLRPRQLAALHAAFGSPELDLMGPLSTPWAGLAGAWGVRWLVTSATPLPEGLQNGWELVVKDTGGCIYRNSRELPVARIAGRTISPPGDPAAGRWEGVEFASVAVADEPLPVAGEGSLEITRDSPTATRMRVRASGTVLAVLHVPLAPGWRAYVDDAAVPLHLVDLAAMSVIVPAGTHTVRFAYWPAGLLPGAALTVAGLAGCAVLVRRRRGR
jgi:hypothetical protein